MKTSIEIRENIEALEKILSDHENLIIPKNQSYLEETREKEIIKIKARILSLKWVLGEIWTF